MRRRLQLGWVIATNGAFAYFISTPLVWEFRVLRAMESSLVVSIKTVLGAHPIIAGEVALLLAGIGLEIARSRFAAYVNIAFFAAQFVIFVPAIVVLARGKVEPELVPFVVLFGMLSLPIAVANYFCYRRRWHQNPQLDCS